MKMPVFVVLGPPKEDPNCFIVYDTFRKCSMPWESYAIEYHTYEQAQEEADERNKELARRGSE